MQFMKTRSLDPPCFVELAIRALGGKRKLLILRVLLLNGAQRYNAILRSVDDISAKELTRNLRALIELGLVVHSAPEPRASKVYAVSELGARLMPVFKGLGAVGKRLSAGPAPRSQRGDLRGPSTPRG